MDSTQHNLRDHRATLTKFIHRMRSSDYWQQRPYSIQYLREGHYRLCHIAATIPSTPTGLHILDIGTTPFTFYLSDTFPQHQFASVDLTRLWASYCQTQGITFQTCDLVEDSLPYDPETFDVVIFTEVLEHLDAPPTVILRKLWRVLKPGGRFIFSVPNLARLQNRIRLLCGRSPLAIWRESPPGIHGQGHLREYTRSEAQQLLTDSRFQITHLKLIQPRVFDAFKRRNLSFCRQVVTAMYYVISHLPGCQAIVFVECTKPS
jgi:SAM-dependent methyltransferase